MPGSVTIYLIWLHAALGGLALVAGYIAAILKKGSRNHKRSGRLFVYSMCASAAISLIVAVSPKHESAFLFCIGLFTLYLTISGYRVWKWKPAPANMDRLISLLMFITGIIMILVSVAYSGNWNVVLLVFGSVGIFLSLLDFRFIRKTEITYTDKINNHIGKITGALISSTTAFIVVNGFIPGLWGWFSPTVVGVIFMLFHFRKKPTA